MVKLFTPTFQTAVDQPGKTHFKFLNNVKKQFNLFNVQHRMTLELRRQHRMDGRPWWVDIGVWTQLKNFQIKIHWNELQGEKIQWFQSVGNTMLNLRSVKKRFIQSCWKLKFFFPIPSHKADVMKGIFHWYSSSGQRKWITEGAFQQHSLILNMSCKEVHTSREG